MERLRQRIEEIDRENNLLRKDREMNKALIEKQLRKIKELWEVVELSRQKQQLCNQDYEDNGKIY